MSLGNYIVSKQGQIPNQGEINQNQSSEIFALENVCGEVSLPVPGMGWDLSPVPSKTLRADTLCCLGKQTKINRREMFFENHSLFEYFILIISDF